MAMRMVQERLNVGTGTGFSARSWLFCSAPCRVRGKGVGQTHGKLFATYFVG